MSDSFNLLSLKKPLLQAIADLNYLIMSPIQQQAIPNLLNKQNLIAIAKTGSGKTAAFGIPAINNIDVQEKAIQSVICCPTRELCEQVANELRKLARHIPNLRIMVLHAGQSEYLQTKSLENTPHIIVGTCSRILKHERKMRINLSTVDLLILDEADKMFDMGFEKEVIQIIEKISSKCQKALFSATIQPLIKDLIDNYIPHAIHIQIDTEHSEDVIIEHYVITENSKKDTMTLNLLRELQPAQAIIFVNYKKDIKQLYSYLLNHNVSLVTLHGDLTQAERIENLIKFENQSARILIATDVAARGIDFNQLDLVINFQLPRDIEVYVHRVGRTARNNSSGEVINLVEKPHYCKEYESIVNRSFGLFKPQTNRNSSVTIVSSYQTLLIHGGKRDKLRKLDILGALIGVTGIDPKFIGKIDITDSKTYVAISTSEAKMTAKKLGNGRIKKRRFKISLI